MTAQFSNRFVPVRERDGVVRHQRRHGEHADGEHGTGLFAHLAEVGVRQSKKPNARTHARAAPATMRVRRSICMCFRLTNRKITSELFRVSCPPSAVSHRASSSRRARAAMATPDEARTAGFAREQLEDRLTVVLTTSPVGYAPTY